MSKTAMVELPALMTQKELCEYLGKSEAWAERCRLDGNGVPFAKIGRSVRYRASDVEYWINKTLRKSTSGQAA